MSRRLNSNITKSSLNKKVREDNTEYLLAEMKEDIEKNVIPLNEKSLKEYFSKNSSAKIEYDKSYIEYRVDNTLDEGIYFQIVTNIRTHYTIKDIYRCEIQNEHIKYKYQSVEYH